MTVATRPLRLLGFAAAALFLAVSAYTVADPDLWGHVRFGLDLLRSHQLSAVDPYSFTQDVPWINHEWLSELQMGIAYSALGPAGLSLLKGVLATLAVGLVWRALVGVRFDVRFAVVALAILGTLSLGRTLRPQLWSAVCMAVLCQLLVSKRRSRRWWLPALFAVWANLHGGWIVGIGVLTAWSAGQRREDSGVIWARLGLVATCVLATLATPYGWHLWAFLLHTVRVTRPNIEEWRPLWSFGPALWLAPLIAAAGIGWILRKPFPGRRASLLALGVLAFAGLRVARVAPFLAEAGAIFLAQRLASLWPQRPLEIRTVADRTTIAVAPLVLSIGTVAVACITLRCIPVDGRLQPDSAVVAQLQGAEGRLVTFFDWGQYAIWHFGPALRVSIDGRRETVYSERRIAEHDEILSGTVAGFATLAAWNAEYVWLPATSRATRFWLESHGYRIDVDTTSSFLAVRADVPKRTAVDRVAPMPRGCFPD